MFKTINDEEIEASGDAIIISQAMHAIADGLQAIAKAMGDGPGDPNDEAPEVYMDGSPVHPRKSQPASPPPPRDIEKGGV